MFNIPEWTFDFHGHRCPFMPTGYMMGTLSIEKLGVGKSLNHEMHIFSDMGVGHPQGCMQEEIMSAYHVRKEPKKKKLFISLIFDKK